MGRIECAGCRMSMGGPAKGSWAIVMHCFCDTMQSVEKDDSAGGDIPDILSVTLYEMSKMVR